MGIYKQKKKYRESLRTTNKKKWDISVINMIVVANSNDNIIKDILLATMMIIMLIVALVMVITKK